MTNYNFRYDADTGKLYFVVPGGTEIEIVLVTDDSADSDD